MSIERIQREGHASNVKSQVERFQKLIERRDQNRDRIDPSKIRKYAIISTPRVGSSMFCHCLESVGNMGWPTEWFHPSYIQTFAYMTKRPNLTMVDGFGNA